MSNVNIFQNATKTAPESDEQIVRVSMKELEIQGRTSHLPAAEKSGVLPLSHVPNAGSTMK
jgi:hypothetical protein